MTFFAPCSPAKAGAQGEAGSRAWTPAFAGERKMADIREDAP